MNKIAFVVLLSSVLLLVACASEPTSTEKSATAPKTTTTTAPASKTAAPAVKTTVNMATKPKNEIEIIMEGDQRQKVQIEQPKATINGADVTAKPSKKKKVEVKEKKAAPSKSSNPAQEIKTMPEKIKESNLSKSMPAPKAAATAMPEAALEKAAIEAPKSMAWNHSAWDALLRKYVSARGQVNYKGFKKEEGTLDAYLKVLANNTVESDWSREKKMAYWINAYNAFTIKKIVNNYPLSSITKLDGGKPWDKKWIDLGDKTYTLNNIENDILRPKYKDARIHFAVNCAAQSCPPILNRAWTEKNLSRNFEQQAKAFINNTKYNKISAKKVEISKIFEWYAGDFGNIIDYLNQYSDTKINSNAKVSYLEYDWALNE